MYATACTRGAIADSIGYAGGSEALTIPLLPLSCIQRRSTLRTTRASRPSSPPPGTGTLYVWRRRKGAPSTRPACCPLLVCLFPPAAPANSPASPTATRRRPLTTFSSAVQTWTITAETDGASSWAPCAGASLVRCARPCRVSSSPPFVLAVPCLFESRPPFHLSTVYADMLRHLEDKDVLFHHTEAEGEWTPLMVWAVASALSAVWTAGSSARLQSACNHINHITAHAPAPLQRSGGRRQRRHSHC